MRETWASARPARYWRDGTCTPTWESRGSHLFREFLREAHALDTDNGDNWKRFLPALLNYTVAFDINDPVNTPRGLDTVDNPVALQAWHWRWKNSRAPALPLDAKLGISRRLLVARCFHGTGVRSSRASSIK